MYLNVSLNFEMLVLYYAEFECKEKYSIYIRRCKRGFVLESIKNRVPIYATM